MKKVDHDGARTAEAGQVVLEALDAAPWGRKYPIIAPSWRHWVEVIPFCACPIGAHGPGRWS